jgi:hypothetical protein
MKNYLSVQILCHCSISVESISGIVIYIFTLGKDWQWKYIDNSYLYL